MADHPKHHHQKDAALESFMQYARVQGIQMHPSIKPYHFPRHGSGVCAAGVLEV